MLRDLLQVGRRLGHVSRRAYDRAGLPSRGRMAVVPATPTTASCGRVWSPEHLRETLAMVLAEALCLQGELHLAVDTRSLEVGQARQRGPAGPSSGTLPGPRDRPRRRRHGAFGPAAPGRECRFRVRLLLCRATGRMMPPDGFWWASTRGAGDDVGPASLEHAEMVSPAARRSRNCRAGGRWWAWMMARGDGGVEPGGCRSGGAARATARAVMGSEVPKGRAESLAQAIRCGGTRTIGSPAASSSRSRRRDLPRRSSTAHRRSDPNRSARASSAR